MNILKKGISVFILMLLSSTTYLLPMANSIQARQRANRNKNQEEHFFKFNKQVVLVNPPTLICNMENLSRELNLTEKVEANDIKKFMTAFNNFSIVHYLYFKESNLDLKQSLADLANFHFVFNKKDDLIGSTNIQILLTEKHWTKDLDKLMVSLLNYYKQYYYGVNCTKTRFSKAKVNVNINIDEKTKACNDIINQIEHIVSYYVEISNFYSQEIQKDLSSLYNQVVQEVENRDIQLRSYKSYESFQKLDNLNKDLKSLREESNKLEIFRENLENNDLDDTELLAAKKSANLKDKEFNELKNLQDNNSNKNFEKSIKNFSKDKRKKLRKNHIRAISSITAKVIKPIKSKLDENFEMLAKSENEISRLSEDQDFQELKEVRANFEPLKKACDNLITSLIDASKKLSDFSSNNIICDHKDDDCSSKRLVHSGKISINRDLIKKIFYQFEEKDEIKKLVDESILLLNNKKPALLENIYHMLEAYIIAKAPKWHSCCSGKNKSWQIENGPEWEIAVTLWLYKTVGNVISTNQHIKYDDFSREFDVITDDLLVECKSNKWNMFKCSRANKDNQFECLANDNPCKKCEKIVHQFRDQNSISNRLHKLFVIVSKYPIPTNLRAYFEKSNKNSLTMLDINHNVLSYSDKTISAKSLFQS